MSIVFECPQCGQTVKAPEKYAGKQVKCPTCGRLVPIPELKIPASKVSESPIPPPKTKSSVADPAKKTKPIEVIVTRIDLSYDNMMEFIAKFLLAFLAVSLLFSMASGFLVGLVLALKTQFP